MSIWDYLFQPISNNPKVIEAYWEGVNKRKQKKEIHQHVHLHNNDEQEEHLERIKYE